MADHTMSKEDSLTAAYCLAQAGYKVTILEVAPAIGDIDADIQVSPNLTHLLIRWGLGKRLKEVAVKPEASTFRRCERYGAPYYHTHGADFYRMGYGLAEPHYTIHTNCRVIYLDTSKPTITRESGEVVHADLAIGVDVTLRQHVVGRADQPRPTGDVAYKAIIPTEKLLQDPDLRPLVEKPEMVGRMDSRRHIMAYNIYNLVMVHPDNDGEESWTANGSTDEIRVEFSGWELRIQKLLAMIPSTLNWKLMDRDPLETWIHKDGKLVLLGDSYHLMLVDDAAVLGNIFSHLAHRSQIVLLLHAYQSIRYDRATAIQDSARNANQWADKEKNTIQFAYDADDEAEEWWRKHGHTLMGLCSPGRMQIEVVKLCNRPCQTVTLKDGQTRRNVDERVD
ncbi:FAD/NAD(P)-binding domain-containing protein [Suillus ampliporus]|nr:FAD/NAD(P)-binding domain-containing protein [Suillus ampliporus]